LYDQLQIRLNQTDCFGEIVVIVDGQQVAVCEVGVEQVKWNAEQLMKLFNFLVKFVKLECPRQREASEFRSKLIREIQSGVISN
jgi:hypothetical protein